MTQLDELRHEAMRHHVAAAWVKTSGELSADEMAAIRGVLSEIERGQLRVASPDAGAPRGWRVHEWVRQAILLHFRHADSQEMRAGDLFFRDRVGVQGPWTSDDVRVVPPGVVRCGAYVAPGVVVMPSFVNIGAYIGPGTMIDTWATVGSCAQIGARCHISGGVGIGGVLEPLQATPVIIEDNVFIGARSEVAEGCIVREGAVLSMGCYVGASTPIFNAMTKEVTRGEIPARAVVVPGSLPSRDGSHQTYALIIKKFRDEKTDARTALNEDLR